MIRQKERKESKEKNPMYIFEDDTMGCGGYPGDGEGFGAKGRFCSIKTALTDIRLTVIPEGSEQRYKEKKLKTYLH